MKIILTSDSVSQDEATISPQRGCGGPATKDVPLNQLRKSPKMPFRLFGINRAAYPPDLQDAAVQNVLQQAEALSAEWAA